jgi:hypothetical protein
MPINCNTITNCLSRLNPWSSSNHTDAAEDTARPQQPSAHSYQSLVSPRSSSARAAGLRSLVEAPRTPRSRSGSITPPMSPLAKAGVAQPTKDEHQILI